MHAPALIRFRVKALLILLLRRDALFGDTCLLAGLRTQAENNADANLIYQAVYEDANLTVTEEHKNMVLQSYGVTEQYYQNLADTYGEGFLNQAAIRFAVLDYVKGLVTIE